MSDFDQKAETVRALVAEAFPGAKVDLIMDDQGLAFSLGLSMPDGRRTAVNMWEWDDRFDVKLSAVAAVAFFRMKMRAVA